MAVPAPVLRDNLSPDELVRAVLRLSELSFLRECGEVPFLAIRISPESSGVAAGLDATLAGAETHLARPIGAMNFHTEMARPQDLAALAATSTSNKADSRLLASALAECPRYLVALRKRRGADGAFTDRISIGRAPNKDIVLRHASISKFHAWISFDEMGGAYVADAGSKNGTRVNGNRLTPKDSVSVQPGDVLAFGSIEGLLCDPRWVWRAVHQGA